MILYADWSSTALNLALVERGGRIVGRRCSESDGAAAIAPADFPLRLAALAGDWLGPAEAIYVSGMATGRGNWQETGYVPAPAVPSALLDQAIRLEISGRTQVLLLPGLCADSPLPDVMRGEELKIWGLAGGNFNTVVLPGKHSKWSTIRGGKIERFATFLSGEIGALLRRDSVISRLIPSDAVVTDAGMAAGLAAWGKTRLCGGGILRAVFSARSAVLAGQLTPADIPGYLHALMLAAEIEEARGEFVAGYSGPLALVGEPAVCAPFAHVLGHMGLQSRSFDGLELGARTVAAIHGLQASETRVHNVEQQGG